MTYRRISRLNSISQPDYWHEAANTPDPDRQKHFLLASTIDHIKEALAQNHHLIPEIQIALSREKNYFIKLNLAENPATILEVYRYLFLDDNRTIQLKCAWQAKFPEIQLFMLQEATSKYQYDINSYMFALLGNRNLIPEIFSQLCHQYFSEFVKDIRILNLIHKVYYNHPETQKLLDIYLLLA